MDARYQVDSQRHAEDQSTDQCGMNQDMAIQEYKICCLEALVIWRKTPHKSKVATPGSHESVQSQDQEHS